MNPDDLVLECHAARPNMTWTWDSEWSGAHGECDDMVVYVGRLCGSPKRYVAMCDVMDVVRVGDSVVEVLGRLAVVARSRMDEHTASARVAEAWLDALTRGE